MNEEKKDKHHCWVCKLDFTTKASLARHLTTKRHKQMESAKEAGLAEKLEDLKLVNRYCAICEKSLYNTEALKKHNRSKKHLKLMAEAAAPRRPEPEYRGEHFEDFDDMPSDSDEESDGEDPELAPYEDDAVLA
jgi:hypothetical protein